MVKKVQSRAALHRRFVESQEQPLKIGLILECSPDGPDKLVCEYLISRLRPNVEVVSITLINKPNLIAECGKSAVQLFAEDCDRVIIVWDLFPPWGGEACRLEDREAILGTLVQAGVHNQDIHLVCIRQEVEAWLLADQRAVAGAISRLTGRTPRIGQIREFE